MRKVKAGCHLWSLGSRVVGSWKGHVCVCVPVVGCWEH
jgi:hypothetical protein